MTNYLIKLIPIIVFSLNIVHPQVIINLQNNFGYTVVDVSEAMEIPEYSDFTETGLNDWDQLNYKGLVQIFLYLCPKASAASSTSMYIIGSRGRSRRVCTQRYLSIEASSRHPGR